MDDAKTFTTDAIHEENPAIQDRTIVAVFSDAATAGQAREALKIAGYKDIDVTSSDPSDEGKPLHQHDFWDRIKAIFGAHDHAPLYGAAVGNGNSLVTFHTEQGRAVRAIDILDSFRPVEVDVDGGAQASTALREPVGSDVPATPDATIASAEGSVLEEDLLIDDVDPDLGNERVRGYSRKRPVVVANQDHGVDDDAPVAEAIKRAD